MNDKKDKAFFSKDNPDGFVKYGKYQMRIRDKTLIEYGYLTRAKVRWWGGGYAHPYLWKENKSDTEYKKSWGDPRMLKVKKTEKAHANSTNLKKNQRPKL